jgi:hypothetical protein
LLALAYRLNQFDSEFLTQTTASTKSTTWRLFFLPHMANWTWALGLMSESMITYTFVPSDSFASHVVRHPCKHNEQQQQRAAHSTQIAAENNDPKHRSAFKPYQQPVAHATVSSLIQNEHVNEEEEGAASLSSGSQMSDDTFANSGSRGAEHEESTPESMLHRNMRRHEHPVSSKTNSVATSSSSSFRSIQATEEEENTEKKKARAALDTLSVMLNLSPDHAGLENDQQEVYMGKTNKNPWRKKKKGGKLNKNKSSKNYQPDSV